MLYASRNVLAEGDCIAVYDLGGGTFDAAVLRKTAAGFVMLGNPEGIEHLGGMDYDAAVFEHVITSLGDRLRALPNSDELTAGLTRLRRECVEAKEALSGDTDTVVHVSLPGLSTSVRLNRSEFEAMIGPTIDDTVKAMRRALRSAGLEPDQLTAIVMTGGSSRIPLVTHMLHTAFGRPLALDTHPKHDVALGATLITPHVPHAAVEPAAKAAPPRPMPDRDSERAPEPRNEERVPPTDERRRRVAIEDSEEDALSRPRAVTATAIGWVAAGVIALAASFTTWFKVSAEVSMWGKISAASSLATDHGPRLGLLLVLGSAALLMAAASAVRNESLLERCAALAGTASVLAVGVYVTVAEVVATLARDRTRSELRGSARPPGQPDRPWLRVLDAEVRAGGASAGPERARSSGHQR